MVAAGPAGFDREVFAAQLAQVVGGLAGGVVGAARSCVWTLVARSVTVNPSGAAARARTAARVVRMRGLFRSMPPTRVASDPARARQLVEGAVGEEADVDAVQGGAEPVDHAGQPADDLGEAVQDAAAV